MSSSSSSSFDNLINSVVKRKFTIAFIICYLILRHYLREKERQESQEKRKKLRNDVNDNEIIGYPIVKTSYGELRGFTAYPDQQYLLSNEITKQQRPIHNFRGVPFAKAPIGNLRFKHSQLPDKWEPMVRDATLFGTIAVQNPNMSK